MMMARIGELVRERLRSNAGGVGEEHLEAAVEWLAAAQDAQPDGGVSHSYLIGKGWMRSYPETTGYIVPTLLNRARRTGSEDLVRRALAMVDWEIDIQLESGAVAELTAGRPTVFDTGQVIFGWVAAHRHSGQARYLDAAHAGGRWLLGELDEDGVWRHESDSGGPGRVYNARVAWALLELDAASGGGEYRDAAARFLEWTLGQERGGSGWFDRNCLTTDDQPLLHTIAYTARGQLESGLHLEDERLLEASRRTARALADRLGPDGFLAGRFDRDWNPAVKWACLTGMAQTSIVWRRLASVEGADREEAARFVEAARRVNAWLASRQDLSSKDPGLRGGIRGSFPVNGAYGKWRVLNWATKFFADALMIDTDPDALEYRG